ncbi:MAG: TfoX/Sxy family protein [Thermoplasmata archaeon]|nr:TfoX/Sxy family protein [Thermoplasmata archaeon]
MHPKIPSPDVAAVKVFEGLTPSGPKIGVKKVFGQPAAFVNGNMFMGVFGDKVFVRLSEEEGKAARERDGLEPFEPMPGRPMRGYVVLPPKTLSDHAAARKWVSKSLSFAGALPPKVPKRSRG